MNLTIKMYSMFFYTYLYFSHLFHEICQFEACESIFMLGIPSIIEYKCLNIININLYILNNMTYEMCL